MLSAIFLGLAALAQAAPSQKPPMKENSPSLSPGLARDLVTAQAFAKSVSGPNEITANWTRAGHDLCSWNGFFCEVNPDTHANALASIDFNGFKLTGNLKLAGFLDKFADLALFHANSNGFTGSVPNLSSLKYLYEIDLSNNQFSGPFPTSVLSIPALTYLDLRFNTFSGPLPPTVFTAFPKIEALFLNNNHLSGPLPSTIGSFRGNYLVLANNLLSGPIPASIAGATALAELNLANNQLSGPVPEALCAIKGLKVLDLTGNQCEKTLGPKCSALKKAGVLKM